MESQNLSHAGKEDAWTSKENDTRYLGGTGCQERLGNHLANLRGGGYWGMGHEVP